MSDSRKKHKVIKIGKNGYLKKYARRLLRKNNEVTNFSNYKRHFDSWDICDYKFYVTEAEMKKESIWSNPKNFRK